MTSPVESHVKNRLLAALPREEYERLEPNLKPVSLHLGKILYEPDERLEYAYFPTTSIISFLAELSDGSSVEVGLVGREGIGGVEAILGVEKAPKVATVQAAGDALRMSVESLRAAFQQGGKMQQFLLRYTHVFMSQISQSVICNVRHNVDRRLARWLLMYHDRLDSDEFYLTHEFMANMLGIRRAGVSSVANALKREGLIDYKRGHFHICNRPGLEEKVCECYRALKAEVERLYD